LISSSASKEIVANAATEVAVAVIVNAVAVIEEIVAALVVAEEVKAAEVTIVVIVETEVRAVQPPLRQPLKHHLLR
jgi:hypothetical protein